MMIKAKYLRMGEEIKWKYFHSVNEMKDWFKVHKECKLISYEEGDQIRHEADKIGLR